MIVTAPARSHERQSRRKILRVLLEDPEAIVLSGPLNAMGEWLRSRVQASLEENAAHSLTQCPPVLLSALGREAGSLGAVSLAMESWKPAHR